MEFIKTDDLSAAVTAIYNRLNKELARDKKVLWLISGGSALPSEVEILKKLEEQAVADKLTVMLMDERYGEIGHADSNWQQFVKSGAKFLHTFGIPVLSEPLGSLESTAKKYSAILRKQYEETDIVVGLFGLGPDGHTAGILPGSTATDDTSDLAICYRTPQYDRVTLTREALSRVNVGYVMAFGEAKLPALSDLKQAKKPFIAMPSVLLHELPEAYVYNDQIGESA